MKSYDMILRPKHNQYKKQNNDNRVVMSSFPKKGGSFYPNLKFKRTHRLIYTIHTHKLTVSIRICPNICFLLNKAFFLKFNSIEYNIQVHRVKDIGNSCLHLLSALSPSLRISK